MPWTSSVMPGSGFFVRFTQGFGVPCLFLVGANEKIYSAEAAVRRLNRVAPQAKAEIIPGAGHDLTIVNPDLVTRKVLEFLGEREGVAARKADEQRTGST
jgi:pimeloyl-ACP methyl ester carboxylesterase